MACPVEGQVLGVLGSIQSSAFFSLGRWNESADAGLAALDSLPQAGLFWCSTVEVLLQVLPNLGQLERSEKLSAELLRIVPAPEARAAYLRSLYVQLVGYAISGAREKGRVCLDFVDKLGAGVSEKDVVARGYARLWRAVFTFALESEMSLALSLAEQAAEDLAEGQVMYRLSLAHTVQAFAWWGLGDLDRSERAARRARPSRKRSATTTTRCSPPGTSAFRYPSTPTRPSSRKPSNAPRPYARWARTPSMPPATPMR